MSHPYIAIIDIDNCIADDSWRRPLIDELSIDLECKYRAYHSGCDQDAVINRHIVQHHTDNGHQLVFITARPEKLRLKTWQWLQRNFGFGEDTLLIMRPTNNHEPSHVLKPWLLLKHVPVNMVIAAYDDKEAVLGAYRDIGVRGCVLVKNDDEAAASPAVAEIMRNMAKTFEERNAIYGSAYKNYGIVMTGLFPDGLTLRSVDDWNRFGLLSMIVSKLNRYASNLVVGGHADSAHDMAVYAAMLEELTK